MKNFLLILALTSSLAHAGATGGFTDEPQTGIVTPEVATGMRAYNTFNNDTNGNMVICYKADENRSGGCNSWRLIQSEVPKGRTYVGFRIVSGSYGYRQLEIYWK